MAGYIYGEMAADDSRWAPTQDIESEGWFAGIHGAQKMNGFTLDFGLVGGWLASSSMRFVNDNLALTDGLTLGRNYASGAYDSWFLAPELGVSMDIEWQGIVYTPAAHIRYSMQEIDGFTETGSSANATVGPRSLGMIEANVEMAASRRVEFGTLTGRVGYLFRHSTGDDAASIVMLGVTNPVGFGDTNSNAAWLGLEADIELSSNIDFVLDGRGYFGNDMRGWQGMARLAASF